MEAKANSIIKMIVPFNFPMFVEKFKQKTYDGTFIETIFNETITKLMAQERVGTADNYKRSINSLQSFKRT